MVHASPSGENLLAYLRIYDLLSSHHTTVLFSSEDIWVHVVQLASSVLIISQLF